MSSNDRNMVWKVFNCLLIQYFTFVEYLVSFQTPPHKTDKHIQYQSELACFSMICGRLAFC